MCGANRRLERAVIGGWSCAASALRYVVLVSRWTRLRPADQPDRWRTKLLPRPAAVLPVS
jgi:hypothetical protein